MLGQPLLADRAKRVKADMQRDEGELDAARLDRRQERLRKVQPRSRGGRRARIMRVDGLVARSICELGANVGWQGRLANTCERSFQRALAWRQAQQPLAQRRSANDLGGE